MNRLTRSIHQSQHIRTWRLHGSLRFTKVSCWRVHALSPKVTTLIFTSFAFVPSVSMHCSLIRIFWYVPLKKYSLLVSSLHFVQPFCKHSSFITFRVAHPSLRRSRYAFDDHSCPLPRHSSRHNVQNFLRTRQSLVTAHLVVCGSRAHFRARLTLKCARFAP